MHFQKTLPVFGQEILLIASGSGRASTADASDAKTACIDAADAGQSLRDADAYVQARAEFVGCARDACPKIVRSHCNDRLAALDQAMPTVVFDRAGKDSVTLQIEVRPGDKDHLVEAKFAEFEATAPLARPPGRVERKAPPRRAPRTSAAWAPPRVVASGAVLLGGLAFAGVGAYAGLKSRSESVSAASERAQLMSPSACAGQPSTAAAYQRPRGHVNAQNRDATWSTVSYAGEAALAAATVATWVFWPEGLKGRPGIAPSGDAVRLRVEVGGPS